MLADKCCCRGVYIPQACEASGIIVQHPTSPSKSMITIELCLKSIWNAGHVVVASTQQDSQLARSPKIADVVDKDDTGEEHKHKTHLDTVKAIR